MNLTRRTLLGSPLLASVAPTGTTSANETPATPPGLALPDLTDARWVWFPSKRTLANTFVLFRRSLTLATSPRRALGHLTVDSRYLLEVNGRRVQWGPAPSDPRAFELDPVELAPFLNAGENVIAVTALHYGLGDGTWPCGKPGFLFHATIDVPGASSLRITSGDEGWQCQLGKSWTNRSKRWYLRSLQEEFDARLFPWGWNRPGFRADRTWRRPMPLELANDRTPIASTYNDYAYNAGARPEDTQLRLRTLPPMKETSVAARLVTSAWLRWNVDPREHFDYLVPDAYAADRAPSAQKLGGGRYQVVLDGKRAAVLTFDLPEEITGWPAFTIDAPVGTTIELLVHEHHDASPAGRALMDGGRNNWSRLICKAGRLRFEPFDFEAFRWMQVHIHGARGPVTIEDVGARRRQLPFPHQAAVHCGDPGFDRVLRASVNTIANTAQETLVDGMGRERQQYSGDIGHQVQALHLVHGETRLAARFLTTFSQGLTKDGYFMDCWPAYDRLVRLGQRQLDLTPWGPIIDHGVGFLFDNHNHYMLSADVEPLRETYPRLCRFVDYLHGLRAPDGLLPVENLGVPTVWIDHDAYRAQRHKRCAFNLYVAAALEHAFAPICRLMGHPGRARSAEAFARLLIRRTVATFWSAKHGTFVVNLPWLREDGEPRTCDRSLAQAVLFNQNPRGQNAASLKTLAEAPPSMGLSYPANAIWRQWALAENGHADVVIKEVGTEWASMDAVRLNNTISEHWKVAPDTGNQMCQATLGPIVVTYTSLAGIRPLAPGFARARVRPAVADLPALTLSAFTVKGPIVFDYEAARARPLRIVMPAGCEGELVLDRGEARGLTPLPPRPGDRARRYILPAGSEVAPEIVGRV